MAQDFPFKGFWILRDTFMRNYYSIFDLDNMRVGLVGSTHIDQISYWRDIALAVCILMAFGGFVTFLC